MKSAPAPLAVSRRAVSRRAFTLVEVLFALAISAVVLAAALSAISMYRHVSTAGRREVEEAQLARAVFRMLELDIRSVAFFPPPGPVVYLAEADESGTATAAGNASDDPAADEPTLDEAVALADGEVGIYGDAFKMVIHADRPTRSLEVMRVDPLSATSIGDRQAIAWFLSASSGAGSFQETSALASESAVWFSQMSGDPRPVQGLARSQGTQAAMKQADETGDIALILSGTRLVAPEVADMRFRYFDGLAWYTEWNTAAAERLPNAVEITIAFRDADTPAVVSSVNGTMNVNGLPFQLTGTIVANAQQSPLRLHRHVVALPSAEPPILTFEDQQMPAEGEGDEEMEEEAP
ncbi:MAG: prepilin-type N-terminal cleavage/methylation domain-containing protein [Planctomycetaceae bacterium]